MVVSLFRFLELFITDEKELVIANIVRYRSIAFL
jgi:hypothetical protein